MSRTALVLVSAVVLAALAFALGPGASAIVALVGAAVLTAVSIVLRPAGWGARLAVGLLVVYVVAWSVTRVDAWRTTRAADGHVPVALEQEKRQRVAGALERRLAENQARVVRVVDRLADDEPLGLLHHDTELFERLGRALPGPLPTGVGVEVYDAAGSLRAWWGDPRGERIPPDSVDVAVERAVVRRPAGFTIAHAAALWPTAADTFRVAVKDLWSVESPFGRSVAQEGLVLPRLEERENLTLRVAPEATDGDDATVIRDAGGEPVATVETERFLVDRFLAERRVETGRLLFLLLLWPLTWAAATVWQASRPPEPRGTDRALALGRRAAILVAAWAFVIETRFLAMLLPASWFSPLAFAEISYGPAGRSPGDFLVATALIALFAISAWSLLPREEPKAGSRRVWIGLGAVGLAFAVGMGAVTAGGPALEGALEGMSPQVFFSATLLFSPPFLMVLLGFGLLAGVIMLAVAAGLRAAGAPSGVEWVVGATAAIVVGIGLAAQGLAESAMAGTRGELAPWLALAFAGSAVVVLGVGRGERRRGYGSPVRVGLAAMSLGALVALPLAAHARVQAAQELLVERADRLGRASSQWVSYTIERTVEFLARDPDVPRAIQTGNRDAALLLWSRSPLRDLDFATGLFLLDPEGEIVSRFTLTAEDWSDRARQMANAVSMSPIAVAGTQDERGVRWAVVPVYEGEERVGTAVAMTTELVELRDPAADASFLLTELLTGSSAPPPDLPGYTILDPGAARPPRMLMTAIRPPPTPGEDPEDVSPVMLAMPLDPLLPGTRGWAVFVLVGAIAGIGLATIDRAMHERARARWWRELRRQNPLRSFRVQLLLAFLVIAAIPLAITGVVGYRNTRTEIEEFTRQTAAEALSSASRLLADDEALERGTSQALGARLRELAGVLRQDLILYWRGRTVASSRPEIFSSRLFADRMAGSVYAKLFADREPLVFDATTLADRSFLVAYRALSEPDPGAGYVLATPLLIREDRARVELERLGEGIFLLGALSLVFLVVVGWGLARFMARPLSALETGTRHIAAGQLSYRLPSPARRDEFGRVQQAFNAMASRLETSQRALEREKSRVQAILASVGAGVVALDAEGRVRLLNERAAALLGQRSDEVVDRTVEELVEDEGPAAFWREVARALAGGGRCDRDLVLQREGAERHYHVVCTGLRDGAGVERGIVVAFEDITDNVQSQRILAWGEMARQVAHEIKNPLTPMKLSLQHLERVIEDREPEFEDVFHQNLDLVLTEIDRLERIAGSFARFAVPEPTDREPVDAAEIAADVVALYGSGDDGIAYTVETVGEPVPVLGDPEGLRRVVVNLVANAHEAVQAGEGSSVTVRLDYEGEPDHARISVVDDGIGLPEEGVERLFEPSFSTKTRGTGLGLAMARRIVESWGGTIEWERREPHGTAMHVRLRAVREGDRGA